MRETDEILREGLCEKGILREGYFARKGFWEKDILRERDFERRTNLIHGFEEWIDWLIFQIRWIKIDRFESSDFRKPSRKKIYFSSIDLISTYVRARTQISRICKFGVLLYVHRTDGYKINKFNKKEWNTKIIKYIISNFYHK